MHIVYSDHARIRMKQRAITELELEHVLKYPNQIKSFDGTQEAIGEVNNRLVKIKLIPIKNHIKIITVM